MKSRRRKRKAPPQKPFNEKLIQALAPIGCGTILFIMLIIWAIQRGCGN